jgi:NAD+ synthase (glutamine-hydrolysing)
MDVYEQMLARVFRRPRADITEENLQARIRGNLLMALSNKFGWLVLTTGNKSENSSATRRCTATPRAVRGDQGRAEDARVPARRLRNARDEHSGAALDRRPAAERRAARRPEDADSLPDYDTLDAILEAYVEEDAGREQLALAGCPSEAVERVFALVDRAEYKRRQAPPGIKITPRAFGRDRRMPITNAYRGG